MQSKSLVVLGLIALVLTTVGLWFVSQGGELPTSTAPQDAEQQVAPAIVPAPVDAGSSLEPKDAAAKDRAERVALAAGSGVDERLPGFVGRVVGPDQRPMAGAKVSVAAGLGFANANGQFDPQSFDFGGFDVNLEAGGTGGFDPAAMLRSVREQLADRVDATTDSEGRFRVVAKGTSRAVGMRVLVRGHAILDRRFDRPRDQDVDVGTLTLQAAAIVSGRVVTRDGAPVAGARVGRVFELEQRLMGGLEFDVPEMGDVEALRGGEGTITDEAGRFELAHVAPGELTLRARHAEHPTTRSQPMTVEAGRELQSVVLTMQVGGVITGVVNGLPADIKGLQVMAARKPKAPEGDASGMNGIAGMLGNFGTDLDELMNDAGFGFGERTAAIGTDGRFELRGLARDTWRVWVARTGAGLPAGAACSARVEASPGDSIQLLFDPGVTLTFTTVDGKSGAPVERLLVRARGSGGGVAEILSGVAAMGGLQPRRPAHYPNGAVTVANLRPKPNQKFTLAIESIGYAPFERRELELPKAGNLDLGTIQLAPVPVLEVTVVALDGGRPVSGATVHLVGPEHGAGSTARGIPREFRRFVPGNFGPNTSGRTDGEGRVVLNRPLQAAAIDVRAQGFAPFASESIVFSADGPAAYTARLRLGGAVTVTVCNPGDKPVPGAVVEHRAPGEGVDTKKADAQGTARFENLAPGVHEFRLGSAAGGLRALARLANRPGIDGNEAAADGPPWSPIDVADKATATLRLAKAPAATLSGIVRENGLPLAGARVAFREGPASGARDPQANALGDLAERFAGGGARGGANRSPRTDERGVYEMSELPEGEHHLRITHDSRATATTVAIVLRNGQNVVDVDLDLTMLRGVVRDSEGKPIEGARIRVRRPRSGGDPASELGDAVDSLASGSGMNLRGGSQIKTDAAGAFEVRGIDADVEIELLASAKGFAPTVAKLTAMRGTTTAAPDLVLGASGKVQVSAAGNQPFGAVRARWAGPGEGIAPVLGMLVRGKCTLDGLRPGTWEVSLESMESLGGRLGQRGQQHQPAQPQQKRTVEVVAGQTVDVQL
ncbi:MAG TPA: carboxypeptidase regulatory-like domain-containing protein [Planctomycetota bacterium]